MLKQQHYTLNNVLFKSSFLYYLNNNICFIERDIQKNSSTSLRVFTATVTQKYYLPKPKIHVVYVIVCRCLGV